jgi:tRNA-splicing ligase RtcB
MDPARFTRVDPNTWRIEPRGAMRVPAIIYDANWRALKFS